MMTIHSRSADWRARRPTLALVVLCAATGCADVDETASPQDADESVAVALRHPERTIRGINFNRHRLAGSQTQLKPVNLASTPIEAQVERHHGFDVFPGAGKADGTFAIDGVPRGSRYWLRVGTNWYLTRERFVDVGVDALGRPDAIGAAAGTSLVFDVDGLAPVTSSDDFQIAAPGAQIGFYSTASFSNPITLNAPDPGDTMLTDAVFPFDADAAAGTSQFPLIQASRGDTLTLSQLTPRQVGSLSYLSLSRALTTTVEMTQGAATTVQGTMTAPPSSVTVVDFRQAAFEALADGIRPGSVPSGAAYFVDASPGGRRVNLGTPDLAEVFLPAGNGDLVLPIAHGNPYPRNFPLFVVASTSFQAPFTGIDENGGPTLRHRSSTFLAWEFVEQGKVSLAPLISSVRDVAIDGRPESDQIQATTATPVVTWKRPRHGRPAAYLVRIVRVIAAAPFAQAGVARLVVTPDVHRVRIPAGVLQPGEHYLFQVVAVASSQPRSDRQLEILFVPPRAQVVDALSNTIRIE